MLKPKRHGQSHRGELLRLESLEDRATPTASSIASNFNGTAIPSGDDVWFSNVAKVSGLGTQVAHVTVTGQTIAFDAGGTRQTLAVPDSTITFDPALKTATASWTGSAWAVATPPKFSGNIFISGLDYHPPAGLPGGIKNVTWQGNFTTDTPGVSVNWQWAAAVYNQFGPSPTDPGTYGVKATDDSKVDVYHNSDHAGTPEAVKSHVVGGATGGGGANYTGSYSGTAKVTPDATPVPPPPAAQTSSISGFVYAQLAQGETTVIQPLAGVTVQLYSSTGTLVASTTSAADGSYSFGGLLADTYTLQEVVDDVPGSLSAGTDSGAYFFQNVTSQVGTVAGSSDGEAHDNVIGTIRLTGGQTGINYDFINNYYYSPYSPNT